MYIYVCVCVCVLHMYTSCVYDSHILQNGYDHCYKDIWIFGYLDNGSHITFPSPIDSGLSSLMRRRTN
jgi:hypothetical protein